MAEKINRKIRKCHMFDRCSGGILNLRFDSEILESFYSECSFPRGRGRFRFCSIFGMLTSAVWLIYFCCLQPKSFQHYLIGCILGIILSITSLLLSYVNSLFKRYFIWICGFYSCFSGLLLLLSFVSSTPAASLSFNLSIVTQTVLLLYTMIPLRLWQHVIVCGSLSSVHIVLSSLRYGFIGISPIIAQIVAHICVHSIGVILHLMSQVWRRSTFLRLGQNSLMRKVLKKEQEIRYDMICSLMPAEVAHEVMQDVKNDGDSQNGKGSDSPNSSKRKKKDRKKSDRSGDTDEFGLGFSDEYDTFDGYIERPRDGDAKDVKDTGVDTPRTSVVGRSGDSSRAVTFRKFHVNKLENVSVLFADIVGFTKMSSRKSASHLVYLLNDLFGRFDRLCELIGCEKIATLGDCYYCVAGCPKPVDDHAERTVELGRAMCLAIQQFDEDHQEEVNMRVGVHTGKVIFGIVGTRRFKFDVWSNDVTLANEMESSGKPGRVHISEATYQFVKDIYTVSEGESVPDIRHFKVLVEYFNETEQVFAIKHTQNQENIKTYFIEERFDGKPVFALPPVQLNPPSPSTLTNAKGDHESQPSAASPLIADGDSREHSSPDPKINSEGEIKVSSNVTDVINEHRLSLEQHEVSIAPVSRGSDVEMLEALREFSRLESVFAFPPISQLTLNFHSTTVESSYRQVGLRHPHLKPDNVLSWSTPRITPIINAILQTVILFIYVFACLIIFPDSRQATSSPIFYIISTFSILFHLLMLTLLLLDLAAWSIPRQSNQTVVGCNWRRCAMRTYVACFRWFKRNLLGAVLLFMPTAVILCNFSGCLFVSRREVSVDLPRTEPFPPVGFTAYYRNLMGILFVLTMFNFTLFITFSSWTKTLSAFCACLVMVTMVMLPANLFADPVYLFKSAWNGDFSVPVFTQQQGLDSPSWMTPVLSENYRIELIVILVLMIFLVGALNREFDISFRLSFHRDYETMQAKRAIAVQQMQSVWLLENIIPSYIMDDLRRTNKYSRHIDDAAVVFACISNFAEFYDEQYQGGQEMLRVLNEIFSDFEHQLADNKYRQVEKIKTVGACFMVASGLNVQERINSPEPNDHLYALIDFAQDLIHILDDFNRQMFNFQFEMKVGYNIGELTAGVIGTTKLLYDIWGDTVNVASRMYSTGQKGRIQVVEKVANRLEDRYVFECRGEVTVKGKGNMKVYLLAGRRPESNPAVPTR